MNSTTDTIDINQKSILILTFLNENMLVNKALPQPIAADTDLIGSGIIDSLALVRLVGYLEEQFNVKISDWDVTPENFQSVNDIVKYLKSIPSIT